MKKEEYTNDLNPTIQEDFSQHMNNTNHYVRIVPLHIVRITTAFGPYLSMMISSMC